MSTRSVEASDVNLAAKLVNIGIPEEKAREAVKEFRIDEEDRKLRIVQTQWHNAAWGLAFITTLTICTIVVAVIIFKETPYRSFDVCSKAITLILTTIAAILILREDPFHEDLGAEATFLERLKIQGKVIAMLTVIGFSFTALSLHAANKAQEEERAAIDGTTAATLDALRILDGKAQASIRTLAGLDVKSRELGKVLDSNVIATLLTLPTKKDVVLKDDLNRRLSLMATERSIATLGQSEWGRQLVTTSNLIATLMASDWGKTLVTTRTLGDTLKKDDWGKTLITTTTLVDTLKDSGWGQTLVTTGTMAEALSKSDWGRRLITEHTLAATLQHSDWGKTLVTRSSLKEALAEVLKEHDATRADAAKPSPTAMATPPPDRPR